MAKATFATVLPSTLRRAALAILLLGLAATGGVLACEDEVMEARAVTWGNATELSSAIVPDPNELVAVAITVPERSTITRVGVIYKASGNDVKAGIYTDAGGAPGTLIAATAVVPVVMGRLEIPLATILSTGTYWVATVHNNDASIAARTGTAVVSRWAAHTFANPLPATFPSSSPVSGWEINYYLAGTAP